MNTRTEEDRESYRPKRNKAREVMRNLKSGFWEKFSKDLEHDMYGNQKRIWKVLRGLKKAMNENIEVRTINEETWTNYFETLYQDSRKEENENSTPPEHP